jgi:TPP-dependent pyruvate/acetoin dehydrogenase alpha subunit
MEMIGGDLLARARGLGLPAVDVDGLDVSAVWEAAGSAIERARSGAGPAFLRARCVHFEGHFLGFQLIRIVRHPLKEMPRISIPLIRSSLRSGGAGWRARRAGVMAVLDAIRATWRDPRRDQGQDPLPRVRRALASDARRLEEVELRIGEEIHDALARAVADVPS